MQNELVPPYSNRGVQNTQGKPLIALVDWVAATFPQMRKPEEMIDFLRLPREEFKELPNGLIGYRKQVRRGHISILYEGGNVDMGVHVIMSGQGCREYETALVPSWPELFGRLLGEGGHFTRLDLAVDDYKGYFKPKDIVNKLESGLTSSRFKDYRYMKKGRIVDGKTKGMTVYLGSPTSDVQFRIYDKLQERKEAGKEIAAGVVHWVRTEAQLSDKRADMAAMQIVYEHAATGGTIGMIVAGVLRNYVTFYEKASKTDKNKSRWPVWRRWQRFIGDVAKLKLTPIAPDRTIDTRRAWIDGQTSKTLGMLFLAYESDTEWLVDTINRGMELLEDKDFDEIETYKRNKKLLDQYISEMRPTAEQKRAIEKRYLEKRIEDVEQTEFSSFEDYLTYCWHLKKKLENLGQDSLTEGEAL